MNRNRIASLLLALVLCLTLLPAAAMAEEEHNESYTTTFDAADGQFPNGSTTMTVQTKWLGAGSNITAVPPDPVREGYTFNGWDAGSGVSIGNVDFTADTTVKALWTKEDAPELAASFRVDFIPNGGVITSIRGISAGDIAAGSAQAAEHQMFVDRNSGTGMMTTDGAGRLDSFPEIKREGCTLDGWYIVSASVLTNAYDGKEVEIPASAKKAGLSTVFTTDALLAAKWTEDRSQDGPFTMKFDPNYKNPKQAEIPKDKTVVKGDTAGLPDGSKLTPPAINLEFYAWCIEGKDGKLYPWKETNPVTGDMTLYAGWVKKGAAVMDGQAIDAAPVEPQTPAETQKPEEPPATPAFTDVEAPSPFAPAIAWAVEQGVTNGTTPTTFSPDNPCTRGQLVTFLWRAAGSPKPKTMEAEYADVTNTTAYFYKAIQWVAEMGMEESGTFAPDKTCTRGQLVTFLFRAYSQRS